MHSHLIYYRDGEGEGYALLASLSDSPDSVPMVAYDPCRKTIIRMTQVSDFKVMLNLSACRHKDSRTVMRLIAGMPETFEQLKVMQTVSMI